MSVEVQLPQWGMGMTEGTVLEWLVSVGDTVQEGDDLVEIETAKSTNSLPAPVGGTIAKILVEPEETVPVGEVLAVIDPV